LRGEKGPTGELKKTELGCYEIDFENHVKKVIPKMEGTATDWPKTLILQKRGLKKTTLIGKWE